MAILTYPLNGILYDAEDVETYLCTRTSGVFAADGHFPASVTGSREITIGPGLAWMQNEEFHGKAIYNPENEALTIEEADAYQTRIDRIVLQFDKLLNKTTLTVKKGTPASNPKAPDIERDTYIYELGLYTVNVKNSSISISASDVSSTMLDESVCGIMEDAVTSIPTQELYDQWYAWFSELTEETTAIEQQFKDWFANIQEEVEEEVAEFQKDTERAIEDNQALFDNWFANLQYVLDGDVAGHLQVEIDALQDATYDMLNMILSGTARAWLIDADGVVYMQPNEVGLILDWPICDCTRKCMNYKEA